MDIVSPKHSKDVCTWKQGGAMRSFSLIVWMMTHRSMHCQAWFYVSSSRQWDWMTSWHLLGARHGLCVIIQTMRLNDLMAPPCCQAWVVYAWWIIIVQAVKTVKLSSQSSCQDCIGWIGWCRSDSLTVLTAWGGVFIRSEFILKSCSNFYWHRDLG